MGLTGITRDRPIGTLNELQINARKRMPLEDADQQSVRSIGTGTSVRDGAVDDTCARHIAVQDRTRRAEWLKPVDILKIAELNVGCAEPVPVMKHPENRRVLSGHKAPRSSVDRTMCAQTIRFQREESWCKTGRFPFTSTLDGRIRSG